MCSAGLAGRMHLLRGMWSQVGDSLEKYMNVLAARQKLVATNIANADTPGYRTVDLDFQKEFQNQLSGLSAPQGQQVSDLRVKADGNDVSLDRESRLLAENSIRFSAASSLLRGEFKQMKSAIQDGQGQ